MFLRKHVVRALVPGVQLLRRNVRRAPSTRCEPADEDGLCEEDGTLRTSPSQAESGGKRKELIKSL